MNPTDQAAGVTLPSTNGNPLAGEHAVNRGPAGRGIDLKRSTRAQEVWNLVSGNLSLSASDSSALD